MRQICDSGVLGDECKRYLDLNKISSNEFQTRRKKKDIVGLPFLYLYGIVAPKRMNRFRCGVFCLKSSRWFLTIIYEDLFVH